MKEEIAEKIVKKYSFLKGKQVTLEGIYYEIKDVFVLKTKSDFEPTLKAIEINKDGSVKGLSEANLLFDDVLMSNIGVYILEAFTLKYSENNCLRLRGLMEQIYKRFPLFETEQEIKQKFKTIGEQLICDSEYAQGEKDFNDAIAFIEDNLSQCI